MIVDQGTPSYAAIIDAGSTSSRVFIYQWQARIGQGEPLALRTAFPATAADKKAAEAAGGIQHKQDPTEMQKYLTPPLRAAQAFLKAQGVTEEIQLYLLATGGMRESSVTPEQRAAVLKAAYSVIRGKFARTFEVGAWEDDHVRVIPGRVEGLFGWVALNYGRGVEEQISGLLELGGASMQMAFKVPNAQVGREKICLLSGEHRVYSQTWDGFGADAAMREILGGLAAQAGGVNGTEVIRNPCLPLGQKTSTMIGGSERTTIGSGEFATCLRLAQDVLQEGLKTRDVIPSYLDIASYSEHFYGVSNYWYNYQFFAKWGGYDVRRAYDRKLFASAVTKYCSSAWGEIQWKVGDRDRDTKYTENRCAYTAWMLTLLHDDQYGFGLEMTQYDTWRNLFRFPTTTDLASRSSWTVGAAALIARHGELVFCPSDDKHIGLPMYDPKNMSDYAVAHNQIEVQASGSSCHALQPVEEGSLIRSHNILIYFLSYVVVLIIGYQLGQKLLRRRNIEGKEKVFSGSLVA